MAVIQDLPAEILRRILELGAEDLKCFRKHDLCSTALVAGAWSQPSQELLIYEWSPDIPNAPAYDTSPPPTHQIRCMSLDSAGTAAKASRQLVERRGTRLCCLNVRSVDLASDLCFLLANGVKHLGLFGTVEGDVVFPAGTQLALESLYLSFNARLTTQSLAELVDKAPRLTRLTLWTNGGIPPALAIPFLALVPQLRYLTLKSPFSGFGTTCALLRACTSLRSLELWQCPADELRTLLASTSSRLHLLITIFNRGDPEESTSRALLGALDQPALSQLKRWRWAARITCPSPTLPSVLCSKQIVESWESACRARGIEPRGDERYYTD